MRHYEKVLGVILLVLVVSMATGCTSSEKDEITFEDLLSLETRSDVTSMVGETISSDGYDMYDINLMNQPVTLLVDYDADEVNSWSLTYLFLGMSKVESVVDMLNYEPTIDDKSAAKQFLDDTLDFLTELYGKPDVFESQVNTITYSWSIDGCELNVTDYINNSDLNLIGAVDIQVYY